MKKLKGMQDIVDDKYLYFIKIASDIAEKYGFKFIKTPILEETILFKRSAGDSSDIVNKEMYDFIDKSNNAISLRPEGTAGTIRYFLENGFDKLKQKEKLYYYGSMFRFEKPQKGRFREFNQFGCESIGEGSIYEDISIIKMITEIFEELKIKYKLKINYLGCPSCIKEYKPTLVEFLNKQNDLCEDCQNRLIKNPLRVLDCKIDSTKPFFKEIPLLKDNLCKECSNTFEETKRLLELFNIDYEIDNNLVRGLDYYNGLVFEFTSNELGAQDAICGGGRYDYLIESLNGKKTSAIGFGIGIERVMELLTVNNVQEDIYYIGGLNNYCIEEVIKIGFKLRKKYKTIIEYNAKSFSKLINLAEKNKCNKFILIGEEELKNNSIRVKDLNTKEEIIIKKGDL